MIEDPTDSESDAGEELYEGDDDDAEAEAEGELEVDDGGDPALTPATEEGDDVCVSNSSWDDTVF